MRVKLSGVLPIGLGLRLIKKFILVVQRFIFAILRRNAREKFTSALTAIAHQVDADVVVLVVFKKRNSVAHAFHLLSFLP